MFSSQTHRFVAAEEAKANPEYWAIMQNNFKETLIQEPVDSKAAEEHAEAINKGNLTLLHFDDPDFVRNIYMALRLKKITPNQLVDTILLYYGSQVEFANDEKKPSALHRFSFEEKGPYDYHSIDYAAAEMKKNFKDNLKKIPEAEQCYYTINFSKKREIGFLFYQLESLTRTNTIPSKQAIQVLNAYFKTTYTSHTFKNPQNFRKISNDLMKKLKEQEKNYGSFINKLAAQGTNKEDPTIGSTQLLHGFLAVHERMPAYGISPDYNPDDPNSPLICMIHPTVSAFNMLNVTAHEKDAVQPVFTAGDFTNPPLKEQVKLNRRLIEIGHPDLLKKNEIVHAVSVHPYILTWHDFLHTWRSSAIKEKPLIHFVRALFETYTQRNMSKPIFAAIDMDFNGYFVRLFPEKRPHFISQVLHKIVGNKIENGQFLESDHFVLLAMDMLLRQQAWTDLLGDIPKRFFDVEEQEVSNEFHISREFMDNFNNALDELNNIQQAYQAKSIKFYVLAYQFDLLHDPSNALLFSLSKLTDQLGLLDETFTWGKAGLLSETKAPKEPKQRLLLEEMEFKDLQTTLTRKLQHFTPQSSDPLIHLSCQFIIKQLQRLSMQYSPADKAALKKMQSYMKILAEINACKNPQEKMREFLFQIAETSFQRRQEKRDSMIFKLKKTESWKEWNDFVKIQLKVPSLTDPYKKLLKASIDPKQWQSIERDQKSILNQNP